MPSHAQWRFPESGVLSYSARFFVMGIGSRLNPTPITVNGLRVNPNAYSREICTPSHAQWRFPESAALSFLARFFSWWALAQDRTLRRSQLIIFWVVFFGWVRFDLIIHRAVGCTSIPMPTLGRLVCSIMHNGDFQSPQHWAWPHRAFSRDGHWLKTEPYPDHSWLLFDVFFLYFLGRQDSIWLPIMWWVARWSQCLLLGEIYAQPCAMEVSRVCSVELTLPFFLMMGIGSRSNPFPFSSAGGRLLFQLPSQCNRGQHHV